MTSGGLGNGMDRTAHWERVYETKSPTEVSWYEPHLATSLEWIRDAAPNRSASIIDVGGGASTLVDDLYADGYGSLAVLDISERAIAQSRERLGKVADEVHWVVGDVTRVACRSRHLMCGTIARCFTSSRMRRIAVRTARN